MWNTTCFGCWQSRRIISVHFMDASSPMLRIQWNQLYRSWTKSRVMKSVGTSDNRSESPAYRRIGIFIVMRLYFGFHDVWYILACQWKSSTLWVKRAQSWKYFSSLSLTVCYALDLCRPRSVIAFLVVGHGLGGDPNFLPLNFNTPFQVVFHKSVSELLK